MYDITPSNASDYDFQLSDGTKVDFVKITSKNNIQVRLPEDHADANDRLRIFRRDGSHYKDDLDVTLSATKKPVTASAPTASNDTTGTGDLVVRDGAVYRLVLVGQLAA